MSLSCFSQDIVNFESATTVAAALQHVCLRGWCSSFSPLCAYRRPFTAICSMTPQRRKIISDQKWKQAKTKNVGIILLFQHNQCWLHWLTARLGDYFLFFWPWQMNVFFFYKIFLTFTIFQQSFPCLVLCHFLCGAQPSLLSLYCWTVFFVHFVQVSTKKWVCKVNVKPRFEPKMIVWFFWSSVLKVWTINILPGISSSLNGLH